MTLMRWTRTAPQPLAMPLLRPGLARLLLLAAVGAALAAAVPGPSSAAFVTAAGSDLTRLLRAMALIKASLSVAALAAVFWRLGVPVALPRFAAFCAASAAMAAGPGLIWGMAHVAAGALLLHGGLAAAAVLIWRDPAVGARLATLLARKPAALRPVSTRRPADPDRAETTGATAKPVVPNGGVSSQIT